MKRKPKSTQNKTKTKNKNNSLYTETGFITINAHHSTLPLQSPQGHLKDEGKHRKGNIKSFHFLDNVIFVNATLGFLKNCKTLFPDGQLQE